MRNRYSCRCRDCGRWVPEDSGELLHKDDTFGWLLRCDGCQETERQKADAKRQAAWQAAQERRAQEAREDQAFKERLRSIEAEYDRQMGDPFYARLRAMLDDYERQQTYRPHCLRVLGLHPPVDAATVKRRYRELALVTHPDRGGDPAQFIEIQAAYDEALALTGGGLHR